MLFITCTLWCIFRILPVQSIPSTLQCVLPAPRGSCISISQGKYVVDYRTPKNPQELIAAPCPRRPPSTCCPTCTLCWCPIRTAWPPCTWTSTLSSGAQGRHGYTEMHFDFLTVNRLKILKQNKEWKPCAANSLHPWLRIPRTLCCVFPALCAAYSLHP